MSTLWTRINALMKKRMNKDGKLVKPMTNQERILREKAEQKRGTTKHGKAVARGLRKHKVNVNKAARNNRTKNRRARTMQRLYNKG